MNKIYNKKFEIIDCGIEEEWVYDIEVEDNHNFFANDILVHNSLYVSVQGFVDKLLEKNKGRRIYKREIVSFLDNLSKNLIEPKIEEIYKELFDYTGGFENLMSMKREIIADRAIMIKKKKYVCRVLNSEGKCFINDPYMKYVGIQIRRSDTPEKVKDYLKNTIDKIFDGEDVYSYIQDVEQLIKDSEIEEVAIPKGMNDLEKYKKGSSDWEKGCPMQVRASIVHNTLVKKLGLEHKIRLIKSGDKIKMVPLKLPNPTFEDVIAFDGNKFPDEFDLKDYIDWDMIVYKTYYSVIEKLLNAIGEKIKDEYDFDVMLSLFS